MCYGNQKNEALPTPEAQDSEVSSFQWETLPMRTGHSMPNSRLHVKFPFWRGFLGSYVCGTSFCSFGNLAFLPDLFGTRILSDSWFLAKGNICAFSSTPQPLFKKKKKIDTGQKNSTNLRSEEITQLVFRPNDIGLYLEKMDFASHKSEVISRCPWNNFEIWSCLACTALFTFLGFIQNCYIFLKSQEIQRETFQLWSWIWEISSVF